MSEITQPHDHFFTFLLSQPEDAGTLLRERLPKEVSALLAPEPPELVDGSFVDGEFRDHMTDRLYRARLHNGNEALLYTLLEHKSWPYRKVAWQLYRYMPRILEQWERENPEWKLLPPIICIVVYHGLTKWNIPDEFQALMAGDEALRPYLPNFRFVLVDLEWIDNKLLSSSPRLRVGLLVLKYVFRKDEQLGILEEIGLALREAPEILYQVVLYIILTYENADDAAVQKLIRIAKPEEETKMMSIFAREILAKGNPEVWAMVRQESEQIGEQRGEQRGEQKGMVEILLGQLQERFGSLPDWASSKLADADLDTLKRWSKRIFGAEKIEQIFQ